MCLTPAHRNAGQHLAVLLRSYTPTDQVAVAHRITGADALIKLRPIAVAADSDKSREFNGELARGVCFAAIFGALFP
jgi:hypothetical protein